LETIKNQNQGQTYQIYCLFFFTFKILIIK
jgi:hypothetical protein